MRAILGVLVALVGCHRDSKSDDQFTCTVDGDCLGGWTCEGAPEGLCGRGSVSVGADAAEVAAEDAAVDVEAASVDAPVPETVVSDTAPSPDTCAPQCQAKVCGPDGCGGTCGSCAAPASCDGEGQCTCAPSCLGKACGDDGCGGTCGSCAGGLTCSATGVCELKGFVLVSQGQFTMGSPTSEPGHASDEVEHTVTLTHDFWLKATEVTQKEWQEVMNTSPSSFSKCGDSCPVERVSWWDALAYCNARSVKEGLTACYDLSTCSGTAGGGCPSSGGCSGDYSCTSTPVQDLSCTGYRLPTEAEWEYAARALTPGPTWTGSVTYDGDGTNCKQAPELSKIAWWCGNSANKTHAVGAANHANPWALSDVLGNVWEWCWDGYDSGYYAVSPMNDPTGPAGASDRVIRGGGWNYVAAGVRAAIRFHVVPAYRYDYVGLRPARSAP